MTESNLKLTAAGRSIVVGALTLTTVNHFYQSVRLQKKLYKSRRQGINLQLLYAYMISSDETTVYNFSNSFKIREHIRSSHRNNH